MNKERLELPADDLHEIPSLTIPQSFSSSAVVIGTLNVMKYLHRSQLDDKDKIKFALRLIW